MFINGCGLVKYPVELYGCYSDCSWNTAFWSKTPCRCLAEDTETFSEFWSWEPIL